MRAWFIRCNGETAHNEPGTPRYVPGEPPNFPDTKFNYLWECLNKGFARVGWPGAGDLRAPDWRSKAAACYGSMMAPYHVGFLEQFVTIRPRDLVAVPAYQRKYLVHLGVVSQPTDSEKTGGTGGAYYYYHAVEKGDWYDNAHRVDVRWARHADGRPMTFECPEIGGTWLRGFGPVLSGLQRLRELAQQAGLS
jgi:hypothetical protein